MTKKDPMPVPVSPLPVLPKIDCSRLDIRLNQNFVLRPIATFKGDRLLGYMLKLYKVTEGVAVINRCYFFKGICEDAFDPAPIFKTPEEAIAAYESNKYPAGRFVEGAAAYTDKTW